MNRSGALELRRAGAFLDEIGEIPQHLQVKLLRALEAKEILLSAARRRVISMSACSRQPIETLKKEVDAGRFREDLFYRLNIMEIHIPPLRERPEDIPFCSIFSSNVTTRS